MLAPPSLKEYLYLDRRRIDSYFEQISGPVVYEKVPTLKVSLSLSGPSAEGLQTRPERPYTVTEKLEKLLNYLQETKQLKSSLDAAVVRGELSKGKQDSIFFLESLSMTPVIFSDPRSFSGRKIKMWFDVPEPFDPVDSSGKRNVLCLIEDIHGTDDGLNIHSSYSSFLLLLQELSVSKLLTDLPVAERSLFREQELRDRFAMDTFGTLRAIGALVEAARDISVLYKVRANCVDLFSPQRENHFNFIIAYPIAMFS